MVESVTRTDRSATVYNLRVEPDHTFFVGEESWGFSLWVHNAMYRVQAGGGGLFNIIETATGTVVKDGLQKGAAKTLTAEFNRIGTPYSTLRQFTKNTLLQAHHLIEKRFASAMGMLKDKMPSMALTRAQHQVFTNEWRRWLPYGGGMPSRQTVLDTAAKVYKDFPEILQFLSS